MAASFSRPDPSSPASVAEAGFATVRRGYSPDEVRAFLASVASELGRAQERERRLEAELADARADRDEPVELDDETLTNLLGEETLRVLQTARESASQIKIRAEENAARILREANEQANRARQEAELEAARRRQDAASEADAEVALAKQQGREMVSEARAYRERVLADLERRTQLARNQIEELVHGRDRLLQVFERARLVAVDVTTELSAIDSPDELVNLAPTTGPVPVMVPSAREAAPSGSRPAAGGRSEQPAAPTAEPQVDGSRAPAAAEDEATDDGGAESGDEPSPEQPAGDESTGELVIEEDPVADEQQPAGEDEPAAPGGDAACPDGNTDGNVVSLFRDRAAEPSEAADPAGPADATVPSDAAGKPDVGGIFARLRSEVTTETTSETASEVASEQTGDVASRTAGGGAEQPAAEPDAAGPDAAEPGAAAPGDPDPAPVTATAFTRRDEALVPLIVAAARKLKRVLADEQNGALDTLRRREPVTDVDALLPALDAHVQAYVDPVLDELLAAAAAGAAELGADDTPSLRRALDAAGALDRARALLQSGLVTPLRERLERCVAEGSGDNDDVTRRVRAVYREWKTQHIDGQLDDVFRFAHGGGLGVTAEPGAALVWTIDPSEPACPDCEDNSLAGPVGAGDAFPTGHTAAPAHPGCRCLALPLVTLALP